MRCQLHREVFLEISIKSRKKDVLNCFIMLVATTTEEILILHDVRVT